MRFAVYANADRIMKHRHAWEVWHTLKDFGCRVFVVAQDLKRYEGCKMYPDLQSLEGMIDVVIPCLRPEHYEDLAGEVSECGAKTIWFQENNWTEDLDEQCKEKGICVIRGCVLKHKYYKKPFAYFHPCYWHGWKDNKIPSKYQRR
jgi:predicted CoA-binding protein